MRAVSALTPLVVFGACGRIAFDPRSDAGDGTGDSSTASCPFGNPQPASIFNNAGALDWAPHESKDGRTLYFGTQRVSGNTELYRSKRATTSDPWPAPVHITELMTASDEEDNPAPSDDELEMYFGRTTVNRVDRTNNLIAWGNRTVVIIDDVQFTGPQGPFLSDSGLHLYFTALVPGADYNMFVVQRSLRTDTFDQSTATPLADINTSAEDGWPYLTADELTIYFVSMRDGNRDLYVATRPTMSSPFGTPTALAAVNSTLDEYDPALSSDGNTLWFSSNRVAGANDYDLYTATRVCP